MTKEEKIKESIKNSKERYLKNQETTKKKSNYFKYGRKIFHEEKLEYYTFDLNYLIIEVGYSKNKNQYQFAVCSEKDYSFYSKKIAKGLIGNYFKIDPIHLEMEKNINIENSLKLKILFDALQDSSTTGRYQKIKSEIKRNGILLCERND